MRIDTPKALADRFPCIFPLEGEERRRAYMFFRGWMALLAKPCEDTDELLEADKRAFHCLRLRGNFTSPSFAYRIERKARVAINIHRPTEVHRHECGPAEGCDPVALVDERVLQLEVELRSRCMVCGGLRRSATIGGRGRRYALCTVQKAIDPMATWVQFGKPLR
ncbi:hypothetical protein [Variovorax sp. J31P207]|uniref:hypothetical protein n=1 Tax=Variovorax sp. J31P207 TaxID=3053510 RepID=UPI0025753161|nr:hypothetical protein [Variovorax sp. J31P207]MDM0069922.1 hypothetical protein [Variovorax sp. J31P207]